MNAPFDVFAVFPSDDPMDASVCFGREQARQAFDAFSKRGRVINVWRVTLDDLARDVTDEFEAEDLPEPVFTPKCDRMTLWGAADWHEEGHRRRTR